ncbi:MAG: hypothetical protein N3E37_03310 [Candidatus Micrarchaeota archaeon]|nr:hypothetical protein [Candidatus Micrarchaeota archaeon]
MDNVSEQEVKEFVEKVEKISKEKKIDLSSDEDLSIGIMNLISIEEHLFFTAQKTGKDHYYEMLYEIREMRKRLLKKIIKQYEGEVWCISKHLLASSMRLMEVGTKALNKGNVNEAKEYFNDSYMLYSLFWALNLKVVSSEEIKTNVKLNINKEDEDCTEPIKEEIQLSKDIKNVKNVSTSLSADSSKSPSQKNEQKQSIFSKIQNLVKNTLDCCIE